MSDMKCKFTTDVKDKFLDMINHLLTVHSDHQVASTLTGLIAADMIPKTMFDELLEEYKAMSKDWYSYLSV